MVSAHPRATPTLLRGGGHYDAARAREQARQGRKVRDGHRRVGGETRRHPGGLSDPGAGQVGSPLGGLVHGLAITHEPNGDTTLAGPLADPAALYGVISKIRDLGLELLAVVRDG